MRPEPSTPEAAPTWTRVGARASMGLSVAGSTVAKEQQGAVTPSPPDTGADDCTKGLAGAGPTAATGSVVTASVGPLWRALKRAPGSAAADALVGASTPGRAMGLTRAGTPAPIEPSGQPGAPRKSGGGVACPVEGVKVGPSVTGLWVRVAAVVAVGVPVVLTGAPAGVSTAGRSACPLGTREGPDQETDKAEPELILEDEPVVVPAASKSVECA